MNPKELTQTNLTKIYTTSMWRAEFCSDFNWLLVITLLIAGHTTAFWIFLVLTVLTDTLLGYKVAKLAQKLGID